MKKVVGFIGCALVVIFMILCKVWTEKNAEVVNNLYITFDEKEMSVGETINIKFHNVPENAKVSFKSSDKEVARTVAKGKKIKNGMLVRFGRIEAKGVGTSVITVTMEFDGKTVCETVNVNVAERTEMDESE